MSFLVTARRRAEEDLAAAVNWTAQHSPVGAIRLLDAVENLVAQLRRNPLSHGLAPEDEFVDSIVRQGFFHTPRGRVDRAVYVVESNEVRILRIRGPGQPTVSPDELGIG